MAVSLDAPECTLKQTCGDYLVIEHNGDAYSCDFFVEPAWRLGNVADENLIDIFNSSRQQKFGLRKGILEKKCRGCKWLRYCYGGCPKDRLNNPENLNLSAFCQSYQQFFRHANQSLRDIAEKLKQNSRYNPATQFAGKDLRRKIGRNDPCSCGSGKKYKKCCMNSQY